MNPWRRNPIPLALLALAGGSLLAGCGSRNPSQDAPYVTVDVQGVIIRPGKPDGTSWDGMGGAAASTTSRLGGAALFELAAPEAMIVGVLGRVIDSSTAAPDAFGTIELRKGEVVLGSSDLPEQSDTFTPAWRGSACWTRFRLTRGTNVRIRLMDRDLSDDDEIDDVLVDYDTLVKASREKGPVAVPTRTLRRDLAVPSIAAAIVRVTEHSYDDDRSTRPVVCPPGADWR